MRATERAGLLPGLLYFLSSKGPLGESSGLGRLDRRAPVRGGGRSYVLSLGGWALCGGGRGWVPVAVLIEFRVLLNQEFFAAWISFIRAPL